MINCNEYMFSHLMIIFSFVIFQNLNKLKGSDVLIKKSHQTSSIILWYDFLASHYILVKRNDIHSSLKLETLSKYMNSELCLFFRKEINLV